MLGAVFISAVILVVANIGEISQTELNTVISPSNEETVVEFGSYSITIPGDTITKDEALTVTEIEELTNAFEGFESLCPALDINLGDLHQFEKPIEIELPYNKEKIPAANASEAFIAVFYDAETGYWEDVPYEVDEDAGVVRLLMYHLTPIECYYSSWNEQMEYIYDNGSVKIYYSMSGFAKTYSAYEKAVGRSTETSTSRSLLWTLPTMPRRSIRPMRTRG
jgi:hypothetical protein